MTKILGVLFCVGVVVACTAAEFSKGDLIELTQDVPLLFKDTAARTGKKGERFTVLAHRAQEHRVYVSARDAGGQEIALNIAEEAVAPVVQEAVPPSGIPTIMAARFGALARAKAMAVAGGKPASEEAVMRGLRWLAATQNEDGSWGGRGSPAVGAAMTGFSILSFLGHGETPASPEFGSVVKKSVDWLIANGNRNEGRLSMESTISQPGVYAHGIATYALSEYYTITGDRRAVDLLKKAVGYIVAGQGPDGGWMYAYDKSESDTSVSGWQIQALKAAQLSGLNIDGVDTALQGAVLNLQRVQGQAGGFGYRNASRETYSLTGVGLLCTYLLKPDEEQRIRAATAFILTKSAREFPVDYKGEKGDLYAWYYITQACADMGGPAWKTWNGWIQDQLVQNQSADGSWPAMVGKVAAFYQRQPEGVGPLFRTNFCVLMLEAYYRYQPPAKP